MANGHSPDKPKGQGGMAKPYTQPPKHSGVKDGKVEAPKGTIKFGHRPSPK
jgi:hypothetical protein